MSCQICPEESLSSVAVAAFDYTSHSFCLCCFSSCFPIFFYLKTLATDFGDLFVACLQECLGLETRLFHYQGWSAGQAAFIKCYCSDSNSNYFKFGPKCSKLSHCFT